MVMKKQNTKGGTMKNGIMDTTKSVPINMKTKGGKITMMTKGGSVKKINMMTKGGSVKKYK